MLKLSIIIPVYNTEEYISKCVNSCVNQNVDNNVYEIIVVNDGSTDNSLNILLDFEKKYKNITVVSQKNKKQGAARNNGLGIAKGEYVWFVDSDDWIEKDAISEILNFLKNRELEIIRIDAVDHGPMGNVPRPCNHIKNHLYARHEALLEVEFSNCVPFHVFKKSFLQKNGLFFLENIFYEDNEFMIRAFEKVNSFLYFDKCLYNVLIRENSTTRSIDYSRKLDLIKVIESQIYYSNVNKLSAELKRVFGLLVSRHMNSLLSGTANSKMVFIEAIRLLNSVEGIVEYTKCSKSVFHIIELKLLKYPLFLRIFLLKFYKHCN
jgi:glycosyltransferase involved in cell wall biosynthesis